MQRKDGTCQCYGGSFDSWSRSLMISMDPTDCKIIRSLFVESISVRLVDVCGQACK